MGKSTQIASKAPQWLSSESCPPSAPIAPEGVVSPAREARRGHTKDSSVSSNSARYAELLLARPKQQSSTLITATSHD